MSKQPLPHDASLIDAEDPPAYSGPSSPRGASTPAASTALFTSSGSITGLPNVQFSNYSVPESDVSSDQTTTTTYTAKLSSDPAALSDFVYQQAALPPRPELRITGTHTGYDRNSITDFDLRLNLIRYILPSPEIWHYLKLADTDELAFRGGTTKTRAQKAESISDWFDRFTRDQVTPRTFTLVREVINWDTEYLEGQIRSLIAVIKYRGHVSVTFPVAHSKVVVHSPHAVNQFFSRIVSSVLGKKEYEVVKSVWPYATQAPNASDADPRRCAVQSERAWWSDWKSAIEYAMMVKKQGWVSLDDVMETAMGVKQETKRRKDWGADLC